MRPLALLVCAPAGEFLGTPPWIDTCMRACAGRHGGTTARDDSARGRSHLGKKARPLMTREATRASWRLHHHRPALPVAECSLLASAAAWASDLPKPNTMDTFSGERRTRLRVVPHQSQMAEEPSASCTWTPARTAWRHSRRDEPVPRPPSHTHVQTDIDKRHARTYRHANEPRELARGAGRGTLSMAAHPRHAFNGSASFLPP
jgi:hypothetical protein